MTPGFLPGDELVQSSSGRVLYEVESVLARIQRVKVVDLEHRAETLLDESELREKVASGEIRVRRKGLDWEKSLHDRTEAESVAHQAAMQFLQELLQLKRSVGADSKVSHRADPNLSQGWTPSAGRSSVDKCRSSAVC